MKHSFSLTKSKQRPAFTLLELLVASALFVGIMVYATSTLANTLHLDTVSKENQQVASQSQKIATMLEADIQSSLKNDTPNGGYTTTALDILPLTDGNQLISMVVPLRDAKGNALVSNSLYSSATVTSFQKRVYCLQSNQNPGAKSLVRFTLAADAGLDPSKVNNPSSLQCTADSIKILYSGSTVNGPFSVADDSFQVTGLHFWPVWSASGSASTSYNLDPPAVEMEMRAQYNPNNHSTTATDARTTESAVPSLTTRQLINRSSSLTLNP